MAFAIKAGKKAESWDQPSAVQVWMRDKVSNRARFLCSGVMIAPDVALTVDSCLTREGPRRAIEIWVSAKDTNLERPLEEIMRGTSTWVKKGIKHPKEDLYILFLNKPFDVDPAYLLSPQEALQLPFIRYVTMVGFGQRTELQEPASWGAFVWGSGQSKVVPSSQKMLGLAKISNLDEHEFELGRDEEDAVACEGDQGAPVYAQINSPGSNSFRLVGLIQDSADLKKCARPTFALRLDPIVPYISEQLALGCSENGGERVWCKEPGLPRPEYRDFVSIEEPEAKPCLNDTQEVKQPKLPPTPPKAEPLPSKTPKVLEKNNFSVRAEASGCGCQQVFAKRK